MSLIISLVTTVIISNQWQQQVSQQKYITYLPECIFCPLVGLLLIIPLSQPVQYLLH